MPPTRCFLLDSPIGPLLLSGGGEVLTGLDMESRRHGDELPPGTHRDDALFRAAKRAHRSLAPAARRP